MSEINIYRYRAIETRITEVDVAAENTTEAEELIKYRIREGIIDMENCDEWDTKFERIITKPTGVYIDG